MKISPYIKQNHFIREGIKGYLKSKRIKTEYQKIISAFILFSGRNNIKILKDKEYYVCMNFSKFREYCNNNLGLTYG